MGLSKAQSEEYRARPSPAPLLLLGAPRPMTAMPSALRFSQCEVCALLSSVCKCLGSGELSIGSPAGRRMQPGLSLPFSVACLWEWLPTPAPPSLCFRRRLNMTRKARARRLWASMRPGSPGEGSSWLGAVAAGFKKGLSSEQSLPVMGGSWLSLLPMP